MLKMFNKEDVSIRCFELNTYFRETFAHILLLPRLPPLSVGKFKQHFPFYYS